MMSGGWPMPKVGVVVGRGVRVGLGVFVWVMVGDEVGVRVMVGESVMVRVNVGGKVMLGPVRGVPGVVVGVSTRAAPASAGGAARCSISQPSASKVASKNAPHAPSNNPQAKAGNLRVFIR